MPTITNLSRRGFLAGLLSVPAVAACSTAAGASISRAGAARDLGVLAPLKPGQLVGNGRLVIVHGHLPERIDIQFRADGGQGEYIPEALLALNRFFRDFHAEETSAKAQQKARELEVVSEQAAAKLSSITDERKAGKLAQQVQAAQERARKAMDAARRAKESAVASMDPRLLDTVSELQRRFGGRPLVLQSGYRTPETNAFLQATGGGGVATTSLHMKGMAMDLLIEDVALKTLHDAAVALNQGGVGYYPVDGFIHVDVGPVRYWAQESTPKVG